MLSVHPPHNPGTVAVALASPHGSPRLLLQLPAASAVHLPLSGALAVQVERIAEWLAVLVVARVQGQVWH